MHVWKWFLLFNIFVLTHGIENDQRSVNLNLETVLEFNHKDNSADIQFLDNVQKFITKVKGVIDRNKVSRRDFRSGRTKNFTDFIQDVISILNTYNESDYQDVFDILDDEIRKYHYRGCKFYELTENYEIRKLMAAKLDLIRGQPLSVVKGHINGISNVLREEKYDIHVKDLIDYINSLYRQDSTEKFNKVIANLEEYIKPKARKYVGDLVKIVREAIRSIIFDHYTELNANARRELKYKIEVLLKRNKQASYVKSYSTKETIKPVKRPERFSVKSKIVESAKKLESNTLRAFPTVDEAAYLDREERSERMEREEQEARQEEEEEEPEEEEDKGENVEMKEKEEKEEREEREDRGEKEVDQESEVIDSKKKEEEEPRKDVSTSDYEMKVGNMRDGMEDEIKDYEGKNRASHTKLDSNHVDAPEYAEVTVKQVARSNQRTTKRNYMAGMTFSSDDRISEDVGTVEDNSLEFHAEEQTTTRQRSFKNDLPRFMTLWEETATGGIPQYLIDQFESEKHKSHKKKHKLRHKPHKTHESKKHKKHEEHKKHEKHKKESHHKTKLRTKKKKKQALMIRDHSELGARSTAMDYVEFKKMFEPERNDGTQVDNNLPEGVNYPDYVQIPTPRVFQKFDRSDTEDLTSKSLKSSTRTALTTTTPKKITTRRFTRPNPLLNVEDYGNRYRVMPLSSLRDFRKSGQSSIVSREGMSIERFPPKEKKRTKGYGTTATVFVDVNVMKRIKDLERELKDVKSKIGDRNAGKVWNDKDIGINHDSKDKRRSRLVKNYSPEEKKSKYLRQVKTINYLPERKASSVADSTTVKITEKYKSTNKETRSTVSPKLVIQRKTDGPDRLLINDDKPHGRGKMRLVSQDNQSPITNYEEWKEFKINSKNRNQKTTTRSTTIPTTKSSTTTTKTTSISSTTTPKPPKSTKTVPTSNKKVEIFIPVSMPSGKSTTTKTSTTKTTTTKTTTTKTTTAKTTTAKTTTTKTSTTEKKEKPQENHRSFDESSFKIKETNKKLSTMLVSPFAASNVFNYSDSFNTRENLQNEVNFILKKNNISVPTDKPKYSTDTNMLVDKFNAGSLPFKVRKELAFTPAMDDFDVDNNTLAGSGHLFSDPFRNIEEELDFLKV